MWDGKNFKRPDLNFQSSFTGNKMRRRNHVTKTRERGAAYVTELQKIWETVNHKLKLSEC